ncbi:MAG: DUF2065 domain-containing protein [Rhodobacteraceae bacterium]|nr:DUF2065 domain-containing protein [Paracoccaceae bacterium]
MISELVLAFGLVAVLEGLALALAPRRWEDMLARLAAMSPDSRRLIGVLLVAVGVAIVWFARTRIS